VSDFFAIAKAQSRDLVFMNVSRRNSFKTTGECFTIAHIHLRAIPAFEELLTTIGMTETPEKNQD